MFRTFYKQRTVLGIVLAVFITGCDEVLQKPLNDVQIVPIAPGENVTTSSPVNFTWEPVTSAEQYRIQVMSPEFGQSQVLVFDSVLNRNIVSLPLDIGKYQWRVQAINSSSSSEPTLPRNLTIE